MRKVAGHINVARSIFNHPMFDDGQPLTQREAWLWLIANAAWKPVKVAVRNGRTQEIVGLDRGQLTYSRSFLRAAWHWSSDKKVRTFLARLCQNEMLDLQTGQLQTVISICNYGLYQQGRFNEGPAKGPSMGQQWASNGPEEENIINIKRERAPSAQSPSGFEEWYSVYPRKKQPQDAKRAFAKLLASGATTLDALMTKTRAFAASSAALPKEERRFIPYPASWLNAGGYDDEPDGTPQPEALARDPKSFTDADWQKRLAYLRDNREWIETWGPKPGEPGCLVPRHLALALSPICSATGAA